MPSARRQKILKRREEGSKVRVPILKFILPLFVVVAVWFLISGSTKFWNGKDKLSYVSRGDNNAVQVTVLDPKLQESTTLIIPGDTQVDVSGNFGTMRIKNVWQLGVNEKLGGKLLAQTVTKNFLTPTYLWSDSDIQSLKSLNLLNIIKFVFVPTSTNIPFGDRLSIAIFSFQIKNVDSSTIDLAKSQFLQRVTLSDGASGYIVNGPISPRITVNFSDNDFADQNLRVDIVDATNVFGSANIVGRIIEVLGGKVVSIDRKTEPDNSDCTVLGVNPKIVKKIASLFGCKTSADKTVFDLEIRLGTLFAKRY